MKRFLIAILSAGLFGLAAFGQPIPIFENHGLMVTGTNNPPQIDALAFANYGTFDVFSSFLPYDFTDVQHFTNRGSMSSGPGFIFDTAFSNGKQMLEGDVSDTARSNSGHEQRGRARVRGGKSSCRKEER